MLSALFIEHWTKTDRQTHIAPFLHIWMSMQPILNAGIKCHISRLGRRKARIIMYELIIHFVASFLGEMGGVALTIQDVPSRRSESEAGMPKHQPHHLWCMQIWMDAIHTMQGVLRSILHILLWSLFKYSPNSSSYQIAQHTMCTISVCVSCSPPTLICIRCSAGCR